jgi:gas vesicle protein
MMETLEDIKVRLERLRDAGKDLIEEFAPMLYAEQQEHARTSSELAQCLMAHGRLIEQVVAQSKDSNQQSRTMVSVRATQGRREGAELPAMRKV